MHLLHDVLEPQEVVEAVTGEDQLVAAPASSPALPSATWKAPGMPRAPHLLGLRDALVADVVALEHERRAVVIDREAARARAAAEIEASLRRPAELAPHEGRPGQSVDQRTLPVVRGDERMIEPGIPFTRGFDLQVVAPLPALGREHRAVGCIFAHVLLCCSAGPHIGGNRIIQVGRRAIDDDQLLPQPVARLHLDLQQRNARPATEPRRERRAVEAGHMAVIERTFLERHQRDIELAARGELRLDQAQRIGEMLEAVRHHDDVVVAADLVADDELVLRVGAARARDRFQRDILADDRAPGERVAQRIEPVAERAAPVEDREPAARDMIALRGGQLRDQPRHEIARLRRTVVALPLADPELRVEERRRIDVVGEQDGHYDLRAKPNMLTVQSASSTALASTRGSIGASRR